MINATANNPLPANPRPAFLFENHEDEIYHSLSVKKASVILGSREDEDMARVTTHRPTDPEYYAFLNQPWVFNRRMVWREGPDRTLLCFCEGGDLPLTGADAASRWFSDPDNSLKHSDGGSLCFVHHSERRCDAAVLPGLQFGIEQHPVLRLDMLEADAQWQCCVYIKGRAGPPVVFSDWQSGPATIVLDIAGALDRRGYRLHFAEVHIAVGLWGNACASGQMLRFRAELPAVPAITPCLPVIRTVNEARNTGIPVAVVVTDSAGGQPDATDITVTASSANTRVALRESNGIWHGRLTGLPEGTHDVRIAAEGTLEAETALTIRVTDGAFVGCEPATGMLTKNGKALGPLNGSYQGLVYFRNVGRPNEAMVQGQKAYDAWDRDQPPGEHWHYWESLTEAELDARFAYLAANGWTLAHLSQHWGVWEKLDVGGRIAPHGAEQVALYYRAAARHGLNVVQALTHYPYGTSSAHTTPVQAYLDAGYSDTDWLNVGSHFSELLHGYLRDYAKVFRDETALAFMTASGEGDIAAGAARANDMMRCVAGEDSNHLFLSEPIHGMQMLPEEHVARWMPTDWIAERWRTLGADAVADERWKQPLFGSRLYWIGRDFEPELDIGIECKFMRTAPVFVAEGSWPCADYHFRFGEYGRTWCGRTEYRTRVRDSLYQGLLYRIPIVLTWEEQLTEDEHRVFNLIRSLVDWTLPPAPPQVCVRVDSSCVRERRDVLRRIELALTRHGLSAAYRTPAHHPPDGALLTIDAREGAAPLPAWIESGPLPSALDETCILRVSDGYGAFVEAAADGRQWMAYLCNVTRHEEIDYTRIFAGKHHRLPVPTALEIEIRQKPPMPLHLIVFDLNRKCICHETVVEGPCRIPLGETDADFFVVARAD